MGSKNIIIEMGFILWYKPLVLITTGIVATTERMNMSETTRVNISFPLEGEEAEKFLAYKKNEFIKNISEAARKLMLESLHQLSVQDNEVSAGRSAERTPAEKAA